MAFDDLLSAVDRALGLNGTAVAEPEVDPEEEKRRRLGVIRRAALPPAQLESGELPGGGHDLLNRFKLPLPPASLGAEGTEIPTPRQFAPLPAADLASAPQETFERGMASARGPAMPAVDLTQPAPVGEGGANAGVPKAPAVPALRPRLSALQQLQAQGEPKLHGWKRILDIVGQILGPGIEERIPGSPGNYQLRLGEAEREAAKEAGFAKAAGEEEERAARTRRETAEAGLKERELEQGPVEKPPASEFALWLRDNQTGSYQQYKAAQNESKPEGKSQPSRITYDQGIPVSVTGPDQKTYDVNDPNLPTELKPLVESAKRAHKQGIQERVEAEERAAQRQRERDKANEDKLTATTKSMVEVAPKVLNFVKRIRVLVNQQTQQLGPAAGRWSEFMAGKVGASNTEFTRLRTEVGLLQTLLMRMHVGARGGEYIMVHFKDLMDAGKQSPENLLAAMDEIESYAKDVAAEGSGGGVLRNGGAGKGEGPGAGLKNPY